MPLSPDLPLILADSRASWREWLSANHARTTGVWVVTRKKAAVRKDEAHVSAQDLNEECLCFGWIDSKPGKVDGKRTALLCTPRKAGSGWSKLNKDRLERLLAQGLVAPPGMAAIERAKADGSWTMLDAVDALVVPDDLTKALARFANARTNFDAFPPSARRGILEWISQARTEATRAKRVAQTADLAEQDIRANQWRPPVR
jgi:uncharacterized protein YdeI (YjbR/CyaY-like superfamily)